MLLRAPIDDPLVVAAHRRAEPDAAVLPDYDVADHVAFGAIQ